MHKTIGNKVYDTTTAQALGTWKRGLPFDKGYIKETLYIKKSGEYFLYGEGGSRSRYAKRVAPNTWGYGERVLPMDKDEAQSWADNHLTSAAYELVFGKKPSSHSTTEITVQLPIHAAEKLHRLARNDGKHISEIVASMIASIPEI